MLRVLFEKTKGKAVSLTSELEGKVFEGMSRKNGRGVFLNVLPVYSSNTTSLLPQMRLINVGGSCRFGLV